MRSSFSAAHVCVSWTTAAPTARSSTGGASSRPTCTAATCWCSAASCCDTWSFEGRPALIAAPRVTSEPDLVVRAPFAGTVVAVVNGVGRPVRPGTALVVLEAMKMEQEVIADADGVVRRVEVCEGDAVKEGQALVVLAAGAPG